MNNNLIPEQRLDKNGRLNTKHVRAVKPQALSAKVPAPALPTTKKKLTAAQTRQRTRVVAYSAPGNYELSQQLGTDYHNDDIKVTASDEEFYSVLSVTSRADAFTLLQAGYRTADEASNYLMDNGFEDLLQDNTALCEEALARKIPPNQFIQSGVNLRGPESTDYYFDALEVYCSSLPSNSDDRSRLVVANNVYDGKVGLKDLKEIGFKEIGAFRDKAALFDSLEKINAGTATYTASDLKLLMEKHPRAFRDAIDLTNKLGAEFALSVDDPNYQYVEYLEEQGTDKERSMKLLQYSDQVSKAELENEIYRPTLPYKTLEKCYDAGLTPTQVAVDDYTDQQLDGLLEGVTPGVSSGWL
jgi:hypothetical protein